MDKVLFHMFSDDRFMDLTLYQYGYEQCLPLHSYGPFVRNHFLFHYVISGKGTLLVDDENSQSTEYQLQGGMGFLIEPDCVNTYFADRKDPWEYAWIEFSGLRAKEILEAPVFLLTLRSIFHAHHRMGSGSKMRFCILPHTLRNLPII